MKTLALLFMVCGTIAAQITVTIDDGDARTPNIAITIPAETVASLEDRRFDFTNPEVIPPAPYSGTPAEHLEWIILREIEESLKRFPTPAIATAEAERDAKEQEVKTRRQEAVTVTRESRAMPAR